MKKIFHWLIFVVVAAQVIWLGWNYYARSVELATAPRILISTSIYDPYDFTRGYYQSLNTRFSLPLPEACELFGKSIDQSKLRENLIDPKRHEILVDEFTPKTNHSATASEPETSVYRDFPLAAFWVRQPSGLWNISRLELPNSPEDTAADGEIRTAMTANWDCDWEWYDEESDEDNRKRYTAYDLDITFAGMRNLRYYYPEEVGDFFRPQVVRAVEDESAENQKPAHVDVTVELVVRPTAGVIPRELYLNDIPYTQAAELLRQGKFPYRVNPAEKNTSRTSSRERIRLYIKTLRTLEPQS